MFKVLPEMTESGIEKKRGIVYAANFGKKYHMENFGSIINSDQPVLVDFFATWCGPCKAMEPEIKKLAEAQKGIIRVLKIDIDKNPNVSREFNIQGVPTLILFKGGKVLWRQSGGMSSSQLTTAIKKFI